MNVMIWMNTRAGRAREARRATTYKGSKVQGAVLWLGWLGLGLGLRVGVRVKVKVKG